MAIKGKGRTRSKQIARGPRPALVPVKPPFFLRRWVQVTLAFAAGAGLVAFLVWFTNGLREERRLEAERAGARERETVVRQYQSRIEAVLAPVGQAEPPLGFTAFAAFRQGLADLRKGDVSARAVVPEARNVVRAAEQGADALEALQVVDLVRDRGFSRDVVNYFLNSRSRLSQGLRLFAEAARAVLDAAGEDGADRGALIAMAARVSDLADELLQDGYADYQQVLASAHIFVAPQPPGPGDLGGSP
ncbi:MAG TPA: hypothetical protein VNO17_00165 [Actinomycetota bacterium]|nr:hypothetical protein [Actinomycetota bacterium]